MNSEARGSFQLIDQFPFFGHDGQLPSANKTVGLIRLDLSVS
jgi:hypothetical protein